MKAKFKLLLVLLCAIFSTSCSNEDANFDEPTEALTYDDVRQKFLDAGFQLNVPRDSSAVVIELHSSQEAMDFLNEYMVNKQLRSEISRAGIGTVIYFKTWKRPNGATLCTFDYNGLSVKFTMKNCEIEDGIQFDYFDKDYKFGTGNIDHSHKHPILWIRFVKPITFVVNGEEFSREDIIDFRFELVLNQEIAVVR